LASLFDFKEEDIMEKLHTVLIHCLALFAFFSVSIGGLFAYCFLFLLALYAAFEVAGTFSKKKHSPH
jgi:hypothetical protein